MAAPMRLALPRGGSAPRGDQRARSRLGRDEALRSDLRSFCGAATIVRVDSGWGQGVALEGPYRYVHHPMYAGMLASYVVLPLALGTLWMDVPELFGAMAVVWRTDRLDRALDPVSVGQGVRTRPASTSRRKAPAR